MARIVFGFFACASVRMASLRLRRTSRFLAVRLSRFGYGQQIRRGRVGDDVGRPCERGAEQHGGDDWWRKRRRIQHRGHVCQHNERVSQ
jgi:hypothetical protein